jgi:hypothetical protein
MNKISSIKTIGVDELSTLIFRAVPTIKNDLYRKPNSLPPRIVMPGSKKLVWLESDVIDWMEKNFKEKKIMMGVEWGELYNKYKEAKLDPQNIAKEANHLLAFDDTITNQKGIYPFILTREEKYLNIRKFSDNIKTKVYKKQNEKCNLCNARFDLSQMHADHISPWHKGGKSIEDNCQLLCIQCNLKKSGK